MGNKTLLDKSPFTGNNILTDQQIKSITNSVQAAGTAASNLLLDYYYYTFDGYIENVHCIDTNHYLVGETHDYNGTSNKSTLSYSQSYSVTSTWSASANISGTAEYKSQWFSKLSSSLGFTFTTSNSTQSSTMILKTITIDPGKSGWIKAWLPAGYSAGQGKYKEFHVIADKILPTGFYVYTNDSGFAPLNNSSVYVLNFTSFSN